MGAVRYIEVAAEEVPLREREAAAGAVSWAALDLEMPAPRVAWFTDCPTTAGEAWAGLTFAMTPPPPADSFEHDRPIRGYVSPQDPGTVWIHAGMGRVQAAATALHEACHVFQHRLMGPVGGRLEFEGREEIAAAYANDLSEIARAIATTTPYKGESNVT
jgi:hypothetical protein